MHDRMRSFIDSLWNGQLPDLPGGISWAGFYLRQEGEPDDRALVLGPCRDAPACSPIGLHGACGQALLTGAALVITDVAHLGDGYIACDPRDRSELVIPLFNADDVYAVLDLDSHNHAAFRPEDAWNLTQRLREADLTDRPPDAVPTTRI